MHRHSDRGRLLVPLGSHGRLVAEDLKSFRLQWRKVRVVVDLSADRMVVRDGRRKLGTFPVGKGSPSTPTPTGRFFVTDRHRTGQGARTRRSPSASRRTCRSCQSWLGNGRSRSLRCDGGGGHGCIHAQLDAIRMLERGRARSLVIKA
jgi:hypothetical protein